MSAFRPGLAIVVAALSLFGCEEKRTSAPTPASSGDAGMKGPGLDTRLESAVAAAASAAPSAQPKAAGSNAPPEAGVFGPGAADALIPRGAMSKIELLGDGSEPRVPITLAVEPGAERKVTLSVGVRTGAQSALPTIDFTLNLKVDKPKEGAKEGKSEGAPQSPAGALHATAKVTEARLSANQPGAVPKELGAEIAKLKGSTLRLLIGKNGASGAIGYELSKEARPELEPALDALTDVLGGALPPLPDKPLGVGAVWMTTDRSNTLGIDVVRYRAFRVEKIDKGEVTLSFDTRQYAADEKTSVAGAPPGQSVSIEVFDSQGKGEIGLTGKALFPARGKLSQRVQARFKLGGNQRRAVQTDLNAAFGSP